jgi:hypothetical protein
MHIIPVKILSFIIFLFFSFKAYCQPQACVWDALLNEFPNQTAVLSEDSVFITVIEFTNITFANGGSNFHLFINGIIDQNGSAIVVPSDVLKIKAHTIGSEKIYVDGDCLEPLKSGTFLVVSNPLPVSWLKMSNAIMENNQTHISWSVATQINNEKYIIEHSNPGSYRDALNFSPIAEITGDGTSNETKHYEYIHKSPSIGINYYRIKQIDYDGKYSYSDIASVR